MRELGALAETSGQSLQSICAILNKLNSARVGKIFAGQHLALAIASQCQFLD